MSLKMHVIDVDMSGSALLLESPTHTILIDLAYRDGTNKLEDYLHNKGITDIDLLVITHPHRDHMAGEGAGGLQRFTNAFNVSEIWSNGVPLPTWYDGSTLSPNGVNAVADYGAYLSVIYPEGYTVGGSVDYPTINGIGTPTIPYKEPRQGDNYQYGDMTIKVLHPRKPHIPRANTNDTSIVMQIEYKGKKIMLMGDALFSTESDIMEKYSPDELKSDILYLGHHGMDDGTSSSWYNIVNPSFVTLQRRDRLLTNRVRSLIRSNNAKLYDPYYGEDYYNPDSSKFGNYVFEINSEGISVTPDDVVDLSSMIYSSVFTKINNQQQICNVHVKKNGVWESNNSLLTKT